MARLRRAAPQWSTITERPASAELPILNEAGSAIEIDDLRIDDGDARERSDRLEKANTDSGKTNAPPFRHTTLDWCA